MARPEHIWIVIGTSPHPIAAFTVKHQLAKWLDRKYGPAEDRHFGNAPIAVCRLADGGRDPDARPLWLNPRTLEPFA